MAHLNNSQETNYLGGFSSVGRAPALQAGCQRFESANLHIYLQNLKKISLEKKVAKLEKIEIVFRIFEVNMLK